VNNIQVTPQRPIDRGSPTSLGDGGIRPQGDRKFTTIHKLTILASIHQVTVIAKASASCDAVEFLTSPVGLGVRAIGGVTRADRRHARAFRVDVLGDVFLGHSRQKDLRGRCRGWRRRILVGIKLLDKFLPRQILDTDAEVFQLRLERVKVNDGSRGRRAWRLLGTVTGVGGHLGWRDDVGGRYVWTGDRSGGRI